MADQRILALRRARVKARRRIDAAALAALLTVLALLAAPATPASSRGAPARSPAGSSSARAQSPAGSSSARARSLAGSSTQARTLAGASEARVLMNASLAPERLGHASTIAVGFEVADPTGEDPEPLTGMTISLPAGLSVSTSELGLATCEVAALESEGPRACPRDSEIGHGSAVAEVPFGAQLFAETVTITLYSAPLRDKRARLLVYASGEHPVIANIVFPGSIAPAQAPFGASIETPMPLVPGLPGGPDVALVSMHTTIGPAGIVYTEEAHGKTVRFHPQGLILPRMCPRGGFPFSIVLHFENGAEARNRTRVPCPAPSRQARKRASKRH